MRLKKTHDFKTLFNQGPYYHDKKSWFFRLGFTADQVYNNNNLTSLLNAGYQVYDIVNGINGKGGLGVKTFYKAAKNAKYKDVAVVGTEPSLAEELARVQELSATLTSEELVYYRTESREELLKTSTRAASRPHTLPCPTPLTGPAPARHRPLV